MHKYYRIGRDAKPTRGFGRTLVIVAKKEKKRKEENKDLKKKKKRKETRIRYNIMQYDVVQINKGHISEERTLIPLFCMFLVA